jgi:predicted permease
MQLPGSRERLRTGIESWVRDLAWAGRAIRRSGRFSLLIVLTLGLGIAAATIVFTTANAILFKTLPVDRPLELRRLAWTSRDLSFAGAANERFWRASVARGQPITAFSYNAFETLRGGAADLADVACTDGNLRIATGSGLASVQLVTGTYLQTVGVHVAAGRGITDADTLPGGTPVAVITHALWQREFGGDARILERAVTIRGQRVPIVGVLAPGFAGLDPAGPRDVLLPYTARSIVTPVRLDPTAWGRCDLVARVHDGVSDDVLRARLDVLLSQAIAAAAPQWRATAHVTLVDASRGFGTLRALVGRPLGLLLAAVALLLLITCANIAGMMLARATTREREMATRLALGASRARVGRLQVIEALLLSTLAGVVGAVLSWTVQPAMPALLSRLGEVPGGPAPSRLGVVMVDLAPDGRVLLFVVAIAWICGIVSGLSPARRIARADVLAGCYRRISGPERVRWRTGATFVFAQVTLSVLLAVVTGLLSRSLDNLNAVPNGFEPSRVLFVTINDVRAAGGVDVAVQRFAATPGVLSAAASQWPIFSDADQSTRVCVDDAKAASEVRVDSDRITPAFFETWGVRIIAGRELVPGEGQSAVVNESFARRYLPPGRAVGQTIGLAEAPLSGLHGRCPGTPLVVVGVVADHRDRPRAAVTPMVYVPYRLLGPVEPTTIAVRTSGNPLAVIDDVRRTVSGLPTAVGGDVTTGDEYRDRTLTQVQLLQALLLLFGGSAVLLSAIGVYGLLSYHVGRRTRELGVRLAVGALRSDVARTVLQPALAPVAGGILAGMMLAMPLRRLIEPWLFHVSAGDRWSYGTAAMVFVLVTLTAAIGPALRAIRLPIVDTLRGK